MNNECDKEEIKIFMELKEIKTRYNKTFETHWNHL